MWTLQWIWILLIMVKYVCVCMEWEILYIDVLNNFIIITMFWFHDCCELFKIYIKSMNFYPNFPYFTTYKRRPSIYVIVASWDTMFFYFFFILPTRTYIWFISLFVFAIYYFIRWLTWYFARRHVFEWV